MAPVRQAGQVFDMESAVAVCAYEAVKSRRENGWRAIVEQHSHAAALRSKVVSNAMARFTEACGAE